jgi:1-aminocyclopropane-1-carboxylate deaminase/D-cysteine desulfhydrase-like pyridoxal-dependent ACC family enzyme
VLPLRALSPSLWIKRDDLCADPIGGNKVRALEFLLGSVKQGDVVVTVGSAGSTHALSVATYGRRLGARVALGRWKQEMNPAAIRVADRIARETKDAPVFANPVLAYAWAMHQHLRGAHWIPAGGSTPLGVLGHVNAGLELVDQIDAGALPQPRRVVVPLGTGGTAAGLALAFAIAQREITVVAVRVVPKIVARRRRVVSLANGTARLIARTANTQVPRVRPERIIVAHEEYGGAYGRETDTGKSAGARLRAESSVVLDATYSAKAFAHAETLAADGDTLFWLTFDSRTLSGT